MTPKMMPIGDRIRLVRKKKRFSRTDLAIRIGVSKSTIERWEMKGKEPRTDELAKVAIECDVNVNWLLTGVGDPGRSADELLRDAARPLSEIVETKLRESGPAEAEPRPGGLVSGQERIETPAGPVLVTVLQPEDFHLVGLAEGKISAGPGGVLFGRTADYFPFKKKWLRTVGGTSPERLERFRLVAVSGDSMEPLISPNELVLLDTNDDNRAKIEDDGIYALLTEDGDIVIKRLFLAGSLLTVMSDNRKYRTYQRDINGESLLKLIIGRAVWVGKELV